MKVKDLIQELNNFDEDMSVFVGSVTQLIGGDYADCRERIELKKIKDNVILSPKGNSINVYDFQTES